MNSGESESRTVTELQLSVIPAFNEAATIEAVVHEHRNVARRLAREFEIVVCDDASTDATQRSRSRWTQPSTGRKFQSA